MKQEENLRISAQTRFDSEICHLHERVTSPMRERPPTSARPSRARPGDLSTSLTLPSLKATTSAVKASLMLHSMNLSDIC